MEFLTIRSSSNDTSIVFVHGILSSGGDAWGSGERSWPHLLAAEAAFVEAGIHVVSYQTNIFSAHYAIADIVDALKEKMRLYGILDQQRLVFVCHSMGGLVVRKLIVERALDLARKEIALFLLASPSEGSDYADWLAPLALLFGHDQGDALRVIRNNSWLKQLNKEFKNLKDRGLFLLHGKELAEDKFIILPKFWWKQVVQVSSATAFFPESIKIPGTDHFSIAKPADARAFQHELLCRFLQDFQAMRIAPVSGARADAMSVPPPATAPPRGTSTGPHERHFIASSGDGAGNLAASFVEQLESGGAACWLPARDLPAEAEPLQAIEVALRHSLGVVVMLGPGGDELDLSTAGILDRAIRYKKAITVVHTVAGLDNPLPLRHRKSIHIVSAGDTRTVLDRLQGLGTPEGMKENLLEQLASVHSAMQYVPAAKRERYQHEMRSLEQEIAGLTARAEAHARSTARVMSGLDRERRPAAKAGTPVRERVRVVNAPPLAVPEYFENRTIEIGLIGRFLHQPGYAMLVVHGRGGIGKTALVCRVLLDVEKETRPDDQGTVRTASVVYINAVRATGGLYAQIMSGILSTLPAAVQDELRGMLNPLAGNARPMLGELLAKLPPEPTVVLIDNFEDMVSQEDGGIRDGDILNLLMATAEHVRHSLKIIITTRVIPVEFSQISPARHVRITLNEGLAEEHAGQVLRKLDFDGSAGLRDAPGHTLAEVATVTRGFPRALEAFYAIIANDPGREVGEIIADVRLAAAGAEGLTRALVGEAYSRLSPMQAKLMEVLAIFGGPVSATAVEYVLDTWAPYIDCGVVLARLVALHFVRRKRDEYSLHPIDREYAMGLMPDEQKRAMRILAANYFRARQRPREEWASLSDIEPHLQQFRLRLQAGDSRTAAYILDDIASFMLRRGAFEQTLALAAALLALSDDEVAEIGLRYAAQAQWRLGRDGDAAATQQQLIEHLRWYADQEYDLEAEGNLIVLRRSSGVTEDLLAACRQYLAQRERGQPGDYGNLAIAMDCVADCLDSLGYLDEAMEHSLRAVASARLTDDTDLQEAQMHNLGNRYETSGDWPAAEACFRRALEMVEVTGNPLWHANHRIALARCGFERGDYGEAHRQLAAALEIRHDIGDLRGKIFDLRFEAELFLVKGDTAAALDSATLSHRYATDLRRPLREVACSLGLAMLEAGRTSSALPVLDSVSDSEPGARWDYDNLAGLILLRQGRTDQARERFGRALAQCELWLSRTRANPAPLAGRVLALAGRGACGDATAQADAVQQRQDLVAYRHGIGSLAKLDMQLRGLAG